MWTAEIHLYSNKYPSPGQNPSPSPRRGLRFSDVLHVQLLPLTCGSIRRGAHVSAAVTARAVLHRIRVPPRRPSFLLRWFPSPSLLPSPLPLPAPVPLPGHSYPPPVLLPSSAQAGRCRARGGGHLHEGRWGARGGGAPAAASGEVRCEAAPAPVTSVLNSIESTATPVPPHPPPSTMR